MLLFTSFIQLPAWYKIFVSSLVAENRLANNNCVENENTATILSFSAARDRESRVGYSVQVHTHRCVGATGRGRISRRQPRQMP